MAVFVLHAYHEGLVGVVPSLEERLEIVRKTKPSEELPLRERLMQVIPSALLPEAVVKVGEAFAKAEEVYREVGRTLGTPLRVLLEARTLLRDFTNTCAKHYFELEELHLRLCVPDCPWDGHTIFPQRKEQDSALQ